MSTINPADSGPIRDQPEQIKEVESGHIYPNGYMPKDLTEQTNRLRELFPRIGPANKTVAERQLPTHAEGWFAVPKWESLGVTYEEALERVLAKIAETYPNGLFNCLEGKLARYYLRQTERTRVAFEKLSADQEGFDILVVPAQFGLRHRGCSIRRALEIFQADEFGLDTFSVACMIFTHPKRFQKCADLAADCSGDEYIPDPGGSRLRAPSFCYSDGNRLTLGGRWTDDASINFGSVSGFHAR
jgi:hypothetical protein